MSVAGVLLAAGASRRMGALPKLTLPVPGAGCVLSAALDPLLGAGLSPVFVVLGADADRVRNAASLSTRPGVVVVENPEWAAGVSSSLRVGLAACRDAPAAVVALGDELGAGDGRIGALVEAWRATGAPLAVPVCGDRFTRPILFARELWPALAAVSGDRGGLAVVREHWNRAVRVPVAALLRDVDTPDDHARLLVGEPSARPEGARIPGR